MKNHDLIQAPGAKV